jgi:hypothetical protein
VLSGRAGAPSALCNRESSFGALADLLTLPLSHLLGLRTFGTDGSMTLDAYDNVLSRAMIEELFARADYALA